MDTTELIERTRNFAVSVIKYCEGLPNSVEYRVIKYQIIKCATSVGANYRAACRARSKPEFVAKISIVLEESDESLYWLEILASIEPEQTDILITLKEEALQLVKIFATTRKTAKNN